MIILGSCSYFHQLYVKQHIQSFLSSPLSEPVPAAVADNNGAKRRRLLDYIFNSQSQSENSRSPGNQANVELNTYLDSPTVIIDPVSFWSESPETSLSTLAFQLLSVPSSSAPVERLFSKPGIFLSQRRTRLSSIRLEQLLFFK